MPATCGPARQMVADFSERVVIPRHCFKRFSEARMKGN